MNTLLPLTALVNAPPDPRITAMPSECPAGGEPSSHVIVRRPLLPLSSRPAGGAWPPDGVRGRSRRGGAAVTEDAADAGQGKTAGPRVPPARERVVPAAIRKVAGTRLQLTAPAQGDGRAVGC